MYSRIYSTWLLRVTNHRKSPCDLIQRHFTLRRLVLLPISTYFQVDATINHQVTNKFISEFLSRNFGIPQDNPATGYKSSFDHPATPPDYKSSFANGSGYFEKSSFQKKPVCCLVSIPQVGNSVLEIRFAVQHLKFEVSRLLRGVPDQQCLRIGRDDECSMYRRFGEYHFNTE